MPHKALTLTTMLISLLFISVIWQFAETDIHELAESAWTRIIGKPIYQISTADSAGIPMQLYGTGETHYNPLFIARAAKKEYYRSRNWAQDERFLQLTDWLVENGVETDSTFLLPYYFDYPAYDQKQPWYSALAQAVAMNALAHRASYKRDLDVYAKAIKAMHSLRPGTAGLGFALTDSTNWYMEYPGSEPYYVLNGMIGILLELHYYYKLTDDPLAYELFAKGYNALLIKLPEFDFHGYSRYDLKGNKAGRMYHKKHIELLSQLQELQPHSRLKYYITRWHKADSYPVIWQMLLNPRPKRIIAFLLPFLALWAVLYLTLASSNRKAAAGPDHS